jgi:transcriptional regulator with PAS, ATPase and Fis domain
MNPSWIDEHSAEVTVCDKEGIILYMNEKSIENFKKDGGRALIGKSLIDCHPEPSRSKLIQMLSNGETNVYYTIKNGKKRLIHQAPWYRNGELMGLVEMIFSLPEDMPVFVRS